MNKPLKGRKARSTLSSGGRDVLAAVPKEPKACGRNMAHFPGTAEKCVVAPAKAEWGGLGGQREEKSEGPRQVFQDLQSVVSREKNLHL